MVGIHIAGGGDFDFPDDRDCAVYLRCDEVREDVIQCGGGTDTHARAFAAHIPEVDPHDPGDPGEEEHDDEDEDPSGCDEHTPCTTDCEHPCHEYDYSEGECIEGWQCQDGCIEHNGCRPPAPEHVACEDSCHYARDGLCDDGGPGADYEVCALGTDCADCGRRP